MHIFKQKVFLTAGMLCLLFLLAQTTKAQNYYFRYNYNLDLREATEAPQISVFPTIGFPDEAQKNGVEGTVKISLTLGEDGKPKDIAVIEGLPFGASEAVTKGLEQIRFQPATRNGKPIAVKMFFDYIITATYDEFDKNVTKPKVLEKPAAVYPESQRASGLKGKVEVFAAFYSDGTVKVIKVNSVMPKEFDRAASEAAEKIKFQPAVHKKSKKPVSQGMAVIYDFKP